MTDDDALRAALAVRIEPAGQLRFSGAVLARLGRRRRILGLVEGGVWVVALAACGVIAAPLIPTEALSPAALAALAAAAAGLWFSLRLARPAA